jgi:BTB/POZ domain
MSVKLTLEVENRLEKILERMKHVADITFAFSLDDADQCKANTTLLALQSEVFDSMFSKNSPLPEKIHLPDMEKRTFVDFMDFMYVDYVKLTPDNVFPLLKASLRYKVAELTKQCSNYVIDELINDENCWQIRQEHAKESAEIADKCLDQIVANPNVHFGKLSFLNINADELLAIVDHPKVKSTKQEMRTVVTKWLRRNYTTAPTSDTAAVFRCLERLQKCPTLCEHDNCSIEKTVTELVEKSGVVRVIQFEGTPIDGRKLKVEKVNAEAFAIIAFAISFQEHLKVIGLAIFLFLTVVMQKLWHHYIRMNEIDKIVTRECLPLFFGFEYCLEPKNKRLN